MPIPPLPLFKHRDTVVTPADQNQFVTQFETTMDTMSNDVIPALNLAITDINEKVTTTTTARDEAEDARDIAVDAKDEALTAVATLQAGAIDNTVIAPNKAFSNQYIENNYYDKTEVYNKTEVDTAINNSSQINTLLNKPTPTNTDNFALQEAGGLLKKLSFANLMTWIKSFSFGWGQTWENVTASRNGGVIYTNNTGKLIFVSVRISVSANITLLGALAYVGTDLVTGFRTYTGSANNEYVTVSFPVPNNATYRIDISNSTNTTWYEFR